MFSFTSVSQLAVCSLLTTDRLVCVCVCVCSCTRVTMACLCWRARSSFRRGLTAVHRVVRACVRASTRARSCLRCVDIETSTESRRGHRDPPTHGSCGRSQMFIKHKLNQELPPEHTLYTEGDEWRRKEKAEEGEDALCDAVFTCL